MKAGPYSFNHFMAICHKDENDNWNLMQDDENQA